MDIVRQILAVVFVFAMLWMALWLLRRKGAVRIGPRKGEPQRIESRCKVALSAQHSLHLIRFGEREVLVGLHPSGFTVICEASAVRADANQNEALP